MQFIFHSLYQLQIVTNPKSQRYKRCVFIKHGNFCIFCLAAVFDTVAEEFYGAGG